MDRLEVAQQKYQRIVPSPGELDEQKSDELEAWLRDDVVPVVADLQQNPQFKRFVKFGISRLAAETDTPERLQVVAVADALADYATAIVAVGRQDAFRDLMTDRTPLEELNHRQYGSSSPQPAAKELHRQRDRRCIVEKMADRPWFDLVMDLDFPCVNEHLFLQVDDSSLDEAFAKFCPHFPVLGEGVTRMMWARIEFWLHHLNNVGNRLHFRIVQTEDDPLAAYPQFLTAKFELEKRVDELRATCFSDDEPRMRDACCILTQVYLVYHPRPILPWLGLTEDRYQVPADMLGLEFWRLCELIEYDHSGGVSIRESSRRQTRLIVMDSLQKVAGALADIAPMYRQAVSPEDIIGEARYQYRLLVVTNPRMVFFDGVLLSVNWNRQNRPWELLLNLAAQRTRLAGVDRYALSGSPSPHGLSGIKYRLSKILMELDELSTAPGAQLASRIEITKEREFYLDLAPAEIQVLDLERLGANEWTVDPAEFAAH